MTTVPPPFTVQGAVPTMAQWTAAWSSKQDAPDAPSNGNAYVRVNGAWASQGTLSGWLATDGGAFTVNDPSGYGSTLYITTANPVAGATNVIGGFLKDTGAGWVLNIPDTAARTGSNAGANFSIQGKDDAGAYLPVALAIERATGNVTLIGNLNAGTSTQGAFINANMDSGGTGGVYCTGPYATFTMMADGATSPIIATFAQNSTNASWYLNLGKGATTGANAGYDIDFRSFTDAGADLAHPFHITRSTSVITVTQPIVVSSDARLKENVAVINDALNLVGRLRGVSYSDKRSGRKGYGLVAQEVQDILPDIVIETTYAADEMRRTRDGSMKKVEEQEEKTLGVAYTEVIALLIEAVKTLETRLTTLERT